MALLRWLQRTQLLPPLMEALVHSDDASIVLTTTGVLQVLSLKSHPMRLTAPRPL